MTTLAYLGAIYLWLFHFIFVTYGFHLLNNTDFGSTHRTSTIASVDINFDGRGEIIVAVQDGPNIMLMYDDHLGSIIDMTTLGSSYISVYRPLLETGAKTISAASCDIDGDGRDEIYIQNSNSPFDSNPEPDKLYTWVNGSFIDLFGQMWNKDVAPRYGGHSVSCLDYAGDGIPAFLVTTYIKEGKGSLRVLAMNRDHPENNPVLGNLVIVDVSESVGLNMTRDSYGIAVGPLFGNGGKSDVILTTDKSYFIGSSVFRHKGDNLIMRNNGDETFTNKAENLDLSDGGENGRVISMVDLNNDGILDIVYLNWLGPNRIFIQNRTGPHIEFTHILQYETFSRADPSEIMLISDFDNDGNLDIIMNSADEESIYSTTNQLFSVIVNNNSEVILNSRNFNNSVLEKLHIRGLSASDMNGNGVLELYVSHKAFQGTTLSIFEMHSDYNWIRIYPKSKHGAQARGTTVIMTNSDGVNYQRIIGEGCGYKCQPEPIAHFGLGNSHPDRLYIQWTDGHTVNHFLNERHTNKTLVITYTGDIDELSPGKIEMLPTSKATSISGTVSIPILFSALLLAHLSRRLTR